MSTVKNCDSPAGMGYSLSNTKLIHLTDCPACKYGTLDRQEKLGEWKCADCGKVFSKVFGKFNEVKQ